MLILIIPGDEHFNEETSEIFTVGDVELHLEHSLVSLSKWESKYQKPFLSSDSKTAEQIMYYIEAMIISEIPRGEILTQLSKQNVVQINEYIESSQSATTFGVMPERKGRGEVITAELIYYWMVVFNIPFECQYWHLNRLFSLVRICNLKNSKPKKMSRMEAARQRYEMNQKRRAELGTSG